MTDGDMKYLYAAYKMGGFIGVEPGLSAPDFVVALVNGTITATDVAIIEKEKPVGVVIVAPYQNLNEVHAEWFPWATPRNILEGAVKYLHEKRGDNLITSVKKQYLDFYNKVSRYGVIRKVGVFENLYGEDEHGTLFQSVRL